MLTYTFGQLKSAVEHALGGVPDSRISSGLIVNRAINHLVNAHSWAWRKVITTLDFVQDVSDIVLPLDFGEIIEVYGNAAKYTACRAVNERELLQIRQFGATDTLRLAYTVAVGAQAMDQLSVPKRVLRVAPTPPASVTAALWFAYFKDIPSMAVTGTADDLKYPAIPAGQHDTLYQLCRAFAISMEEMPGNAEWDLANASIQRDIQADSRALPNDLGPMRNTGADSWYEDGPNFYPHTQIRFNGDP